MDGLVVNTYQWIDGERLPPSDGANMRDKILLNVMSRPYSLESFQIKQGGFRYQSHSLDSSTPLKHFYYYFLLIKTGDDDLTTWCELFL